MGKMGISAYLISITSILAAVSASAPAATLYWDADGTTTGLGGTGAWNDSASGWNTDSSGNVANVTTWSSGNSADFRGTAGTVTVGGPVSANAITFSTGGYTLQTNGAVTLVGASGGGTLINHASSTGNTTISGNITVDDTANAAASISYSLTNLTSGTLTINGNINLANSTSGTKTLNITNSNTSTTNVLTSTVILNGSLNAGGGTSTAAVYVGAGSKVGTGDLKVLIGNTGALGIGTLRIGSSSTQSNAYLLTNTGMTITNAVTLSGGSSSVTYVGGNTADDSTFSGGFNLNAFTGTPDIHLTAAASGKVVFSGSLYNTTSGARGIVKDGAGVVALSYTTGNTYKGYTKVQQGTLLLMNTSNSATGTGAYVTPGDAGVQISSAASLGGTGYSTVLTQALDASSIITPGDMTKTGVSSIGTLHLTGGLTAANGVTFNFDIGSSGADQLDLGAGVLTLGGTVTVNLLSQGDITTGNPYVLLTGAGTWSSSPVFSFNTNGLTLDTSYGNGNGYMYDAANHSLSVQFAAVPESATLGLLSLGGLAMLLRKSRIA